MPRGGKREGAGRPKGSVSAEHVQPRSRFTVICTAEELSAVKALAASSGKSLSRYVVDRLLTAGA